MSADIRDILENYVTKVLVQLVIPYSKLEQLVSLLSSSYCESHLRTQLMVVWFTRLNVNTLQNHSLG